MISWKKGYLLQSTESGQIGWTLGAWLILFMALLLCALLQTELFRSTARYMEDALAASNLAAAVIDVEEYGISHEIKIDNPYAARERCMEAMKTNLGLNHNWECSNKSMISGKVQMVNFTVYNVCGGEVEIHSFQEDGALNSSRGVLGQVAAPNGVLVEKTGIYSEITYRIRGFFNVEVCARKGKLADVAKNE